MSKYKCLNPNCDHLWESDSKPFECPNCHESQFKEIRKPRWSKYLLTGGGILIVLILLLQIDGCKQTTVKTDADSKKCKLTVTIEGKHKNEYRIILRKDGAVYGDHKKKDKVTFSDLDGTYSLDVQFVGKEKIPKINSFQKTFTFTKPPKAPEPPQIINITNTPNKLTKTVQVYTVTVTTDVNIVPMSNTEFSKDGTNWQSKNVFPNLSAGTYTFYARNTRDKSLQDQKRLVLEPFIPEPPPTVAQLNGLINQIANSNQSAYDDFLKILGNNCPVKGASSISNALELANEAFISSRSFTVTNIATNSNGDVLSITVK